MNLSKFFSKLISPSAFSSESTGVSFNKETKSHHTFLVVDDDDLFRRLIEKAGRKIGYNIVSCPSLKEATRVKEDYDVVILDYLLGAHERGTDGLAIFQDKPVVLISSVGNGSGVQPDVPASVRKFLPKEVGVKAILQEAGKFT